MRFFVFAIVMLLAVPVYAADATYDRVMKDGQLRCGYIITEALQKDPNTGAIEGIIPDILLETGRLLGIEIEWTEELNWSNFVEAMRSNRVDAICTNFWMDPNGAKHVSYTTPLYFSGVGVYVRVDEMRFSGDDLNAFNDASVKVSSMEGEMSGLIADQDYPKATKVIVPQMGDSGQLLLDVSTGKADVAFVDVAIGKRFQRNNPDKIKNLVPDAPVRVFANTIALPPETPRLKTMLDATLSQLLYGGFVDKVLAKHSDVSDGYYPVAKPYGVLK